MLRCLKKVWYSIVFSARCIVPLLISGCSSYSSGPSAITRPQGVDGGSNWVASIPCYPPANAEQEVYVDPGMAISVARITWNGDDLPSYAGSPAYPYFVDTSSIAIDSIYLYSITTDPEITQSFWWGLTVRDLTEEDPESFTPRHFLIPRHARLVKLYYRIVHPTGQFSSEFILTLYMDEFVREFLKSQSFDDVDAKWKRIAKHISGRDKRGAKDER